MSVFECYNWWTTRWTTESIRRSCLGELDAVMNSKAPPAKTAVTQALIRKLPLKDATYDVRDATVAGLVLRVRPSGSMTYLVRLTDKERRHPRTGKAVRYWWTVGSAAVVTAEHPVAHERPQGGVDTALVLNGQIGNAPAGIELVGCRKRVRRANIQTGLAGTARIRSSSIRLQRQCCEYGTQKQPGAKVP